jgi:hypothetical protein
MVKKITEEGVCIEYDMSEGKMTAQKMTVGREKGWYRR